MKNVFLEKKATSIFICALKKTGVKTKNMTSFCKANAACSFKYCISEKKVVEEI